ncbi:MAG: hypothetical protein K2X27_15500 [Candidatus Obscuribacterales bacterium]|nr:hypothetical protein [Candidatus Obscuribacterales bacterium]
MYTKRIIEARVIWYFSWRMLSLTTVLAFLVYLLYHQLGFHKIAVPFLPIATVGTAVAFYVGFKNNSSYDRLWEARKIWGELTNTSRSLISYLAAVMQNESARSELKNFAYRQIAYVNILRLQLRKRSVWDENHEYTRMSKVCFETKPFEQAAEETLESFCPADADAVRQKKNMANEILQRQMKGLASFKTRDWIDSYAQSDLLKLCNELFISQGKAERIKNFPFPRQYAFFSEVFVYIFTALLPFGLIGEFAKLGEKQEWLEIPFSVLISWIFITMEKVGDTSENPFEGSLNDIPMTTICRNIEIDLKEMLGETELPLPLEPDEHVLM